MLMLTRVALQDADPPERNPHEPNLIITVRPLNKDVVTPVFPSQVSYVMIGGE